MLANLEGKVCIVTGASRGVGRGVALGLAEAGATVHITGRTQRDGEHPGGLDRGGSLASVLEAAKAHPGKVTTHRVDHSSYPVFQRSLTGTSSTQMTSTIGVVVSTARRAGF